MHYYNEDSYQTDENDSITSDMIVVEDSLDLDDLDEPKIKKKRIREKLDHLSHEEKLIRRKMKNRVSAQSARDRKRKLLSTLEKKVDVLCRDRQKILKENLTLKSQNNQIIMENLELRKRLSEIENRLSLISSTHLSPNQQSIQIGSVQTATSQIPVEKHKMNDQAMSELNGLTADAQITSFKPAAFINGAQQKDQGVPTASARKTFSLKTSRRVQTVRNRELLTLIKQLISLFVMMKTSATTFSTSSKTATKICLRQTLKRLHQTLTKQQMKHVLTHVINRLVMMDLLKMEHIQKLKSGLGKRSNQSIGHYQKSV